MIYGVTDQIDLAVAPGPPDTPYTTSAVNFDGSTYLTRGAALTGWGTPSQFIAAVWTKLSAANDGIFSDANFFTQGNTNGAYNVNIAGTYFDSDGNALITSTSWQLFLMSLDISGAPGLVRLHMYVGDVDVENAGATSWGGDATCPAGSDFWFGQDGFNVKITGDVADFRLWVGQYLDFSLVANRRYFIRTNGKPTDPSYAVALLGNPIISFIGNSTNFPTNGGTGGAFSVTGSLSNAGTSPTD